MLRRFLTDERGATAIEYGLVASLIALAIVGGVTVFAASLQTLWSDVADRISEVLAGS
ncbi:Flp family type IVb pilin [Mesorhizobium sp. 8]|uniref:Flp family type IVb pilin n=2 Tax=Hyphomicrobiales TaxID=356 RepID=A0ABY2Q2K9_9HYPH|nr:MULTISPECIES: Flp family type IVb pilin [Mesorhizobium]QDC03225.1 Flp family type IVb pilin [Mesorhizobium sp. 8]THF55126.1 Flp family type IVb pilin [Mesorhizobium composti]